MKATRTTKPMTEKEADKMYEDAKKSGQYSSLRIISDKVANDLYAKGGEVGENVSKYELEKLSNLAYQLQNVEDSWIAKNHSKFVEMQNEYKKQFKKVYGHTNYKDPNEYSKGGDVGSIVTIPTYVVKEINDSVKMGYDTLVEGFIGRKRKGVMLINDKYEVRGTYDISLKNIIQNIIDKIKLCTTFNL